MIIRILGEGQFRVPEDALERLNQLDNEVAEAVEASDEARFHQALARLLDAVREGGSRLSDDELATSDYALPQPDLTLEEAREVFGGEGALPG